MPAFSTAKNYMSAKYNTGLLAKVKMQWHYHCNMPDIMQIIIGPLQIILFDDELLLTKVCIDCLEVTWDDSDKAAGGVVDDSKEEASIVDDGMEEEAKISEDIEDIVETRTIGSDVGVGFTNGPLLQTFGTSNVKGRSISSHSEDCASTASRCR